LEEFFLKEKYLQEGFSSKELSAITFSSRTTITRHLKKHKISPHSITRRETGSHVFGFRKYKGKSIELKKEQEVINTIRTYKALGYSYQKIADILNAKKTETKNKKGIWHPKVVRQIFLRCLHSSVML